MNDNYSRVFQHECDHLEGNVFFKFRKVEKTRNYPEMIDSKEIEYFINEQKKIGRLF